MHSPSALLLVLAGATHFAASTVTPPIPHQLEQNPLQQNAPLQATNVSAALFTELEELARIVDISYCVGWTGIGVEKPFTCLSRCTDFSDFELVTTWNTGPLLSDSCGYIALDHAKHRVLVAFRGTYSIANTVVDLSTVPQAYVPYPGDEGDDDEGKEKRDDQPKCKNCTVHMGFNRAWHHTRSAILADLESQISLYPDYRLNLVGHSLGGAVAALAGLDFQARGWNPLVTTFGEPRIGNAGLTRYLDERFDLLSDTKGDSGSGEDQQYRRLTHVDDPVPLLPLTEWGYAMHAGEIHITKSSLSPDIADLRLCTGDNDPLCIASQDSTITPEASSHVESEVQQQRQRRDLLTSVRDELTDVVVEPWGIPARYKLWQLFFSHRDYFWRLGLCVPGGDPLGGGDGKYEHNEDLDSLKEDL